MRYSSADFLAQPSCHPFDAVPQGQFRCPTECRSKFFTVGTDSKCIAWMSGELLHWIRPGIMSARRDQNIQDFANGMGDAAAEVVHLAVAALVVQGKQKCVDNIINVDKVAEAIERTCHLDRNSSVNVSEIDAEHALLHIRHILSRTVNVEHSKRSRLQAERHVQLKVLLPRKLRNTIEGNWCGHVGFFHRKCFG